MPAVYPVHNLQRVLFTNLPNLATSRLKPVHERTGFLRQTDSDQSVHAEGRVADPGVPVVPVPDPAYIFRKARSRRRDECTCRLIRHQLQDQCRASHYLAPPASVGATVDPAPPIGHGVLKVSFDDARTMFMYEFIFRQRVQADVLGVPLNDVELLGN